MQIQNKNLQNILKHYRDISLLNKISAVLGWDQNVNLPPKAAKGRADQISYITEILTNTWLNTELRTLIEETDDKGLNEHERAILRNARYLSAYYYKVPKDIIIEKSNVTANAFMAWHEARTNDTFATFLPHLEKIIELNKKIAEHLGYKKNAYDSLLHLHEPNLDTAFCDTTFGKLRPRLTELLKRIQASDVYKQLKLKKKKQKPTKYPQGYQKQFSEYVLHLMEYDFQSGRMDISPHPFTTTLDQYDVRITTRYNEYDFRECYTSAVHEGGHALYEQGVDPAYGSTPLEGGVSMGIHESQSRFYENMVGRNPAFLSYLLPHFRNHFPTSVIGENDELSLYLNEVEPGLIRTQADEVTYNLHIILRFELEEKMMNGKLAAKDLPEVWNDTMHTYLGVQPPSDRDGVLQDVHWSYGEFGYFPTYSLGNLYSAQILASLRKDIDMDAELRNGNLGSIHSWLRERIYTHGARYWPDELIKQVTGESLNPDFFVNYLTEKYSQIYKLEPRPSSE